MLRPMKRRSRFVVALSGGVDSATCAGLLVEAGHEVIGISMSLYNAHGTAHASPGRCCGPRDVEDARAVCTHLDIPFYIVDYEDLFQQTVIDDFVSTYQRGQTPNPCVRCNKTIKFGAFFKKMEELGCDYLATGHYARLTRDADGTVHLMRGKDESKDQTYFLYNLSQDKLQKILFPLGDYDKSEVKALAEEFGLEELKGKRESQGVCFYPEKTHFEFLKRYLKPGTDFKPGKIQTKDGEVVGEHQGLPFYTMGQRKGIGIGGGPALYVNKVDNLKNTLIVGNEDELYSKEVELRDINFLSTPPDEEELLQVKVRSQGLLSNAWLKRRGQSYFIEFQKPERAIMAGQSLVMYRGTELIGGGIMTC